MPNKSLNYPANKYLSRPAETLGIASLTPTYVTLPGSTPR
jgi:hypothetical protein